MLNRHPCPRGTTKHENSPCHSGPDPESRCKGLDTGLRRYDNLFSYKYVIFFLTVITVVLLDQLTKAFIHGTMSLYSSWMVIDGFLSITYVRNPGAAFGFLAHASPFFRSIFFVLVTVLAIGMILYYLVKSRADQPGLVFALSLILSGALGNLIDRLRFGEVIDFIDVYWKSYHWPAFNVADAAISVGATLMILIMMKQKKGENAPE